MSPPAVDRAVSNPGPRTGRVLSEKYRLLGKLGEGGMGEVYAAEHTFVGRRFAVKFLRPELARDEQIMSRFRREAQAAGSLENENVVAVTDFGHADDGAPFLVMEYLTGEDLRSLLVRTGRLPAKRAVELIIQACRGLYAAHSRSIVHRDLKPENLFVTKRGDGSDLVKVLDFGIAKLRGGPASGASTKAGTVIGTLLYMPPEQVRGEKDTDHRADIYALGAILYEALGGSVPHPGDQAHDIMYHILYQPPAPLASLRPDLPPELVAIVHRALAAEPADRFGDIAALSEALAPFSGRQVTPLEGSTTEASGVAPPSRMASLSRADTISETDHALSAAGLSLRARARRRTLVWILLVVLVTAVGTGLVLRTPSEPERGAHEIKPAPLVEPAPVPAQPAVPSPASPAPAVATPSSQPAAAASHEATPDSEPAGDSSPRPSRSSSRRTRSAQQPAAPTTEPAPTRAPAFVPRLQVDPDNPYD